jgi:hypothetical protein
MTKVGPDDLPSGGRFIRKPYSAQGILEVILDVSAGT